jgi:hypothetical protein
MLRTMIMHMSLDIAEPRVMISEIESWEEFRPSLIYQYSPNRIVAGFPLGDTHGRARGPRLENMR